MSAQNDKLPSVERAPVRPLIIADSKDNLLDPNTLQFSEWNKNLFGFAKPEVNAVKSDNKTMAAKKPAAKRNSPGKPETKRKKGEAETPAFGATHDKGFFRDIHRDSTDHMRSVAKV